MKLIYLQISYTQSTLLTR